MRRISSPGLYGGVVAKKHGLANMFRMPRRRYRRFMANMSAKDVVERYNQALRTKDFTAARKLLADDVHFEGPIDRFDRADDYVTAISRLYGMVRGVELQATIADGADVATFYVLDTPVARAPVAEWYTVRGGKITSLRAYFDARPFAPPAHQAFQQTGARPG
jgi:ketosteroid isomerase-like protein